VDVSHIRVTKGGTNASFLFSRHDDRRTPAALAEPGETLAGTNAIKWGPAPPSLPAGAQFAVISGDPSKAGPFVVRLKLPTNYQVPAHHHPTTENVTVLSGDFHAGMGDKLDKDQRHGFRSRRLRIDGREPEPLRMGCDPDHSASAWYGSIHA